MSGTVPLRYTDLRTLNSVLIQLCCGSLTFVCGSGSRDPYFWLLGPDLDPDPFFSDISLLSTALKIQVICLHYFCPLNAFERKGKDLDPYIWVMNPGLGGPKTYGYGGSGSWSATLVLNFNVTHLFDLSPDRLPNISNGHVVNLNVLISSGKYV